MNGPHIILYKDHPFEGRSSQPCTMAFLPRVGEDIRTTDGIFRVMSVEHDMTTDPLIFTKIRIYTKFFSSWSEHDAET